MAAPMTQLTTKRGIRVPRWKSTYLSLKVTACRHVENVPSEVGALSNMVSRVAYGDIGHIGSKYMQHGSDSGILPSNL